MREIYTAGGDRIIVFDRLATGMAQAKRIIENPESGGFNQLAVDTTNDEIFVADNGDRGIDPPILGAVIVYDRLADGEAPPKRFIQDAGVSGVNHPRSLWVDPVRDEIGVTDTKLNNIRVFPRVW
ncbi:MAG: hypothetical protein HW416_2256 [Chloroflexi bacterium]|nr:hypothetical protein [Chloroflexota bacterium]